MNRERAIEILLEARQDEINLQEKSFMRALGATGEEPVYTSLPTIEEYEQIIEILREDQREGQGLVRIQGTNKENVLYLDLKVVTAIEEIPS